MHNYVVSENTKITPTTLLITLKHIKGDPLTFRAGQYAAINGYHGGRPMPIRCFSIVSSPTEPEVLQFSMRIKGKFTNAVAGLSPGDKVHVQGPYGGFVLQPNHTEVVMMAGGIGITPLMSMIRFANATHSMQKIHLLYSAQTQEDVAFKDELAEIQNENPHFKIGLAIGKPPFNKLSNFKVSEGRISPKMIEDSAGFVYGNVSTVFYICGPPPFMKGMQLMLREKGVGKSRIYTEAFSQGPNRQTGKIRDWPFSMYALTALSLSAGSLAVMVSDFVKIIPPGTTFTPAQKQTATLPANSRQADLDALINQLGPSETTEVDSDSLKAAIAASVLAPTLAQGQSATSGSPQTTAYSKSAPKTSGSSGTTSTATSSGSGGTTTSTGGGTTTGGSTGGGTTTTPPPTKTCTTSQSGVTTCI